jgi:hypothetical protein
MSHDYEKALRVANKRHDLVAVALSDPREFHVPDIGIVELEDAETGEGVLVDFGDAQVRETFGQLAQEENELRRRLFHKIGVDVVEITTRESYAEPLMQFFKRRVRKIRA